MLLVNSGNRSVLLRINLVLLDEKTNQPVADGWHHPLPAEQRRQTDASQRPQPHSNITTTGRLPMPTEIPMAYCPRVPIRLATHPWSRPKRHPFRGELCTSECRPAEARHCLNTPADEGSLYTPYPQFTWLPPTPVGLFGDLSYDSSWWKYCRTGKADAIQQKHSVYSGGFIKNLFMTYPSSYGPGYSRLYAWRIVALNNGQPTAMSIYGPFRVTVLQNRP